MPTTRKKLAKAKAKELIKRQPQGIKQEALRLYDVLNEDEVRQFVWIHMVLDPWGPITRMPLLLGNGIWDEDLYRYYMFGTLTGNASGVAFGLFDQDNWQSSAGGDVYMGYTTVGHPLWYTDANFVGTTSPAHAATTATAGVLSQPLASNNDYGGAAPDSSTHYVQTASALRVRPISTSDNTSGLIMVVYTKDVTNYPLTGVSYSTVEGYPDTVAIKKSIPLANWAPNTWLEIPAIPHERVSFESKIAVATGTTNVQVTSSIGVFCTGMQASQSVEIQAISVYQVEEDDSARVADAFTEPSAGPGVGAHGPGTHYENTGPRAVMSRDRAQLLTHHARENMRARVGVERNMGSVHPRNPRSKAAARAMLRAEPSLGGRIKSFFSNGYNKVKDYVKDNWLSLLIKGAEGAAMLL